MDGMDWPVTKDDTLMDRFQKNLGNFDLIWASENTTATSVHVSRG